MSRHSTLLYTTTQNTKTDDAKPYQNKEQNHECPKQSKKQRTCIFWIHCYFWASQTIRSVNHIVYIFAVQYILHNSCSFMIYHRACLLLNFCSTSYERMFCLIITHTFALVTRLNNRIVLSILMNLPDWRKISGPCLEPKY